MCLFVSFFCFLFFSEVGFMLEQMGRIYFLNLPKFGFWLLLVSHKKNKQTNKPTQLYPWFGIFWLMPKTYTQHTHTHTHTVTLELDPIRLSSLLETKIAQWNFAAVDTCMYHCTQTRWTRWIHQHLQARQGKQHSHFKTKTSVTAVTRVPNFLYRVCAREVLILIYYSDWLQFQCH